MESFDEAVERGHRGVEDALEEAVGYGRQGAEDAFAPESSDCAELTGGSVGDDAHGSETPDCADAPNGSVGDDAFEPSDSADDEGEWEYVYEDELEEGDVWEYVEEEGSELNPLSYENVQHATDDLNTVYREGMAAARDIKEAVDEMKDLLDIKKMLGF